MFTRVGDVDLKKEVGRDAKVEVDDANAEAAVDGAAVMWRGFENLPHGDEVRRTGPLDRLLETAIFFCFARKD